MKLDKGKTETGSKKSLRQDQRIVWDWFKEKIDSCLSMHQVEELMWKICDVVISEMWYEPG